ncbi:MAG: protein-glutamate O-methyltransferase [bacterium]|nr:protein-glutamate O-methyltransferase [bacterium]
MSSDTLISFELTECQFDEISDFVKSVCGIDLGEGKKQLVKARLTKRLRKLKLDNFSDYMDHVRNDTGGVELIHMLDAISTNLTSFFRENDHFEHLANEILPMVIRNSGQTNRRLRIWSAGCSSGEEPYTIAMLLNENIPNIRSWDTKILATDISTQILARASDGIYNTERTKTIPPQLKSKYFDRVETKPQQLFRVKDTLSSLIHFGRLNLMKHWPMKGPFDVIFCRNVMIYFDKITQGKLINRFYDLLAPGGTLFIGHSESLAGVDHQFQYAQPTVYQRP